MKKIIPLLLVLPLTGCVTLSAAQEQTIMSRCPVLKNYSREQLAQAAIELNMLPNESQLSMMLSDYSKLRDACRVAEKKLKSMYRPKRQKESEQEIYTKGG
jgi:hypothetical protein